MPCTTRAAASKGTVLAKVQISEAIVKTAMPPRKMRRGPKRSPSEANGSMVATTASW